MISNSTIIKESTFALQNYLLASVSDPLSRASTASESFSGDGVTKTFTLSYKPDYFTSVTVDGVVMYYLKDFTKDYANKTITFNTAPVSGSDNIVVGYGYFNQGSNTEKCWVLGSYPRVEPKYPVISIDHSSFSEDQFGVGVKSKLVSIGFQLDVWSKTQKERDELADSVLDVLVDKSFTFRDFGLWSLRVVNVFNNDSDLDRGIRRKTIQLEYKFFNLR